MKLHVVEILKVGLPGLVFLLSFLSYRLLSKEESKETHSPKMLQTIEHFMYVNIFLAILTATSPLLDFLFIKKRAEKVVAEAAITKASIDEGLAGICNNAEYGGRYLLVLDSSKENAIQVLGQNLMPCDGDKIYLNVEEAVELGLNAAENSMTVELSVAEKGQMFILDK